MPEEMKGRGSMRVRKSEASKRENVNPPEGRKEESSACKVEAIIEGR